jgi:hypothetical protein
VWSVKPLACMLPSSQGQAAEKPGAARNPSALTVGDKVEAQFKGGKKWFPAKITAVNRDGTYDVRYDDGDSEWEVLPERVRKPGASAGQSAGAEEPQVSPTDPSVLVEGWE